MFAEIEDPPFPIIQDLTGEEFEFHKLLPSIKLHMYVGEARTAEEARVDTHILCWSLTDKMPNYEPEQAYWFTTHDHTEVTCQSCLEWLHA